MIFFRLFFGWLCQVMPFAALCIQPFSDHLRFSKKKSASITFGLCIGLAIIFALTGVVLHDKLPGNHDLFSAVNAIFSITLVICFLWYLYVVRSSWPKKLFVFSYILMGAFFTTSLNNAIITRLYLGHNDGLPYQGYTLLVLLLLTALVLPILFLILKRHYRIMQASATHKESIYLSIFSIGLFLLLFVGLSGLGYSNLYQPITLFLYVTLMLLVFVLNGVCFKILDMAQEKLIAQQKYVEAQRQLTIQGSQYQQITGNIENARRMRHDLRHHLLAIQGFLKSGEVEQAEQYLSQTIELSKDYEIVKLCGNAVVNLLVGHYQALAKEQGVQFSARIAIPDDMPILDTDLSVVIGNLLENALFFAGQEQGGIIRFNMICSGKMLAVTVDNSFNGTVRMSGGKYFSTKKNHIGYGLESVEVIAEKYSGGVEFAHEGKEFHSSVMMGLL